MALFLRKGFMDITKCSLSDGVIVAWKADN